MTAVKFLVGTCTTALSMICIQPAQAQAREEAAANSAEEPVGIMDIVVTAEKRSQTVQRVPLAITAVDATQIREARVESMEDVVRITPSLNFVTDFGNLKTNIRGVGNEFANPSAESSVLTYVDGVYVPRPTASGAAFNDLERIEVLRGPQGTLYGRNATGGVVNLITRTPGDEFGGQIGITYGRFNRIQANAALEGPLGDNTRARVSFFTDNNDGDMVNIETGERVNVLRAYSARATIVSDVSSDLTLTLRGDYYNDRLGNYATDLLSGTAAANPPLGYTPEAPGGIFQDQLDLEPARPRPNNGAEVSFLLDNPFMSKKIGSTSLTADWNLSDDLQLKSITAYSNSKVKRRVDIDGSSAHFIYEADSLEKSRMISQELTLGGDGFLGGNWIVGLYYFNENITFNDYYRTPALARIVERVTELESGLPPGTLAGAVDDRLNFLSDIETRSISGFGQFSVPITEALKVTAGARYNHDRKSVARHQTQLGAQICKDSDSSSWSNLTWKLGAEYQVAERSLVYASVTKGFRSGGFNIAECGNKFDPETLISYEIGTKNTFADGRILLNVAAFYYDFTDLQVTNYVGTTSSTENASDARIYGVEAEFRAKLTSEIELSGNASGISAEYLNYISAAPFDPAAGLQDLTGNRIPHSVEFQANGAVAYNRDVGPGTLNMRYDLQHNGGFYADSFNTPIAYQKAYTLQNARIAYKVGRTEGSIFVQNIGDVRYKTNVITFAFGGMALAQWGERRTFGVGLKTEF